MIPDEAGYFNHHGEFVPSPQSLLGLGLLRLLGTMGRFGVALEGLPSLPINLALLGMVEGAIGATLANMESARDSLIAATERIRAASVAEGGAR